jgi:hypothetical protein
MFELKRVNEMRRNAILKKMPSYFAEVVIFCGHIKHFREDMSEPNECRARCVDLAPQPMSAIADII